MAKYVAPKGSYYIVTNPDKLTRTLFGETKFHAISRAIHLDSARFTYQQYKIKLSK